MMSKESNLRLQLRSLDDGLSPRPAFVVLVLWLFMGWLRMECEGVELQGLVV